MFHKMPLILVAIIVAIGVFYAWIPPLCQSVLYGVSLSLKSFIVFTLPFLIFGLLFKTAVQLSKQASKWILFLVVAICLSNLFSTWLSYFIGMLAYQFDLTLLAPQEVEALVPWRELSLPRLMSNSHALLAGLGGGLLLGWLKPKLAETLANYLERGVQLLLKVLLYIIPLFIAGFILKMRRDGAVGLMLRNYGPILIVVVCSVLTYVGLLYLVSCRFQYKKALQSIKNMLPAAITGFGSMSSAAAMPLIIIGTEKNTARSGIAQSVIPATVNIHLIGDCFAIPVFAFAILKGFGIPEPTVLSYCIFALYFVLAKFSVASVPGGGILVMLPVLEAHLGFNAEMLSLITTLYILFDPVITSINVLGNGGFAMGMDRLMKRAPRPV